MVDGRIDDDEKEDSRPASVRVLTKANKRNSEELIGRCKAFVDSCVKAGAPVTVKRVALGVGCSTSFIYKHDEILEYIKAKSKVKPRAATKLTKSERLLLDINELEKEKAVLEAKYVSLLKERITTYQREEVILTEFINERLRGIRDHKFRYVGTMYKLGGKEVDENGFFRVRAESPLNSLEGRRLTVSLPADLPVE